MSREFAGHCDSAGADVLDLTDQHLLGPQAGCDLVHSRYIIWHQGFPALRRCYGWR